MAAQQSPLHEKFFLRYRLTYCSVAPPWIMLLLAASLPLLSTSCSVISLPSCVWMTTGPLAAYKCSSALLIRHGETNNKAHCAMAWVRSPAHSQACPQEVILNRRRVVATLDWLKRN